MPIEKDVHGRAGTSGECDAKFKRIVCLGFKNTAHRGPLILGTVVPCVARGEVDDFVVRACQVDEDASIANAVQNRGDGKIAGFDNRGGPADCAGHAGRFRCVVIIASADCSEMKALGEFADPNSLRWRESCLPR